MPAATLADRAAPASARGWALALLLYFGTQVMLRLLLGEGLELDEAEQALWTQELALGYGTQPPLYTWLQWLMFRLFGVSLLALALLKNLLLAGTYLFTFLAARMLMATPLAALAAASMLLIPQIGWESQRDLTHSVACTTLAAATLWAVLSLRTRASPARYLVLGLAAGLGTLAKYSYVGYALALLVALTSARETRPLVLNRRMVAAALVATLVVLPHGLWLLDNLGAATQGTLNKMGGSSASPWALGVLRGFGNAALAVVAFLTPLWIVYAALFVRRGWRHGVVPGAGCGLLRRYLAAVALLLVLLVLAGAATQFKDRWLQPFLFFAPTLFFACAPHLHQHPRLPTLQRVLVIWALLLLAGLAARGPLDGWRNRPDELNVPARALAQALRDAGYDGRPIVSSDRTLAGVLRLQFPHASVQVVGRDGRWRAEGPALWIGSGDAARALAPIEAATGQSAAAPVGVELPPALAPSGATPLRYTFSLRQ